MQREFTCAGCGGSFTMPQAVLDKYSGWIPRQCLPCRDAERGAAPPRARTRRSSVTATKSLTPEQVLERYHEGPLTGIFTDGSAQPNPGPAGWAAVWVQDDVIAAERTGRAEHATNNRMELTALIEAFRMLPPDADVPVYTDSELCVNIATRWAAGWERAGWRRKTGPISNLDLVKELHGLVKAHPRARLEWVPAHSGWRWNEYADALASSR